MIITDNKDKSYETRDLSTLKFITSIFYFSILKQKTRWVVFYLNHEYCLPSVFEGHNLRILCAMMLNLIMFYDNAVWGTVRDSVPS